MLTEVEETETRCQEQRSFLRERFLRALLQLKGHPCDINMHEKSVQCHLGLPDIEFQHLTVSNLQTPLGTLPNALLRMTDIVAIKTIIEP